MARLTPRDIQEKEFSSGFRGYKEEDVDDFLDSVTESYEALFKENIDLKEETERLSEQCKKYEMIGERMQAALVAAQETADDVRKNANKEAENIVREAELKAQKIVQGSRDQHRDIQKQLAVLKQVEEEFRFKLKSMLNNYLKLLEEMPLGERKEVQKWILPEDLTALDERRRELEASEKAVATAIAKAEKAEAPKKEVKEEAKEPKVAADLQVGEAKEEKKKEEKAEVAADLQVGEAKEEAKEAVEEKKKEEKKEEIKEEVEVEEKKEEKEEIKEETAVAADLQVGEVKEAEKEEVKAEAKEVPVVVEEPAEITMEEVPKEETVRDVAADLQVGEAKEKAKEEKKEEPAETKEDLKDVINEELLAIQQVVQDIKEESTPTPIIEEEPVKEKKAEEKAEEQKAEVGKGKEEAKEEEKKAEAKPKAKEEQKPEDISIVEDESFWKDI